MRAYGFYDRVVLHDKFPERSHRPVPARLVGPDFFLQGFCISRVVFLDRLAVGSSREALPGGAEHETVRRGLQHPGVGGPRDRILVDQRLTGLLVGQTLHTRPEEIYRALIEATAFGALTIIKRFEEYGVAIDEVINCGGIAEKNPLVMQIYADVIGKEMKVARSAQTCALGSAIAGAVAAGRAAGGYETFAEAQAAMCGVKAKTFKPARANGAVYGQLYRLYRQLHDGFGTKEWTGSMYNVMKDLLAIRDRQLTTA